MLSFYARVRVLSFYARVRVLSDPDLVSDFSKIVCIVEEDNRNNCIVEEEDNRNNCIIKDGQLEGTPISRRAGKVEVKVSQMQTRFNAAVFVCIENAHREKCVHRKCASRKMSGQSGQIGTKFAVFDTRNVGQVVCLLHAYLMLPLPHSCRHQMD